MYHIRRRLMIRGWTKAGNTHHPLYYYRRSHNGGKDKAFTLIRMYLDNKREVWLTSPVYWLERLCIWGRLCMIIAAFRNRYISRMLYMRVLTQIAHEMQDTYAAISWKCMRLGIYINMFYGYLSNESFQSYKPCSRSNSNTVINNV
ncbi:hypothetical protein M501DRAFT_252981 [Patellaria atrata CBS 101060]|uniref:Uncharacterized protein n=1 Tax=Patellaria atrata CBS 101060 TaxID=1346257 RepID=A0A9P4S5S3_9PEZI|nr:hypothetical protein M501DRAFT_252981 [Patellaria atrata CBS 101060]